MTQRLDIFILYKYSKMKNSITIYNILIISIVLIPLISAFSLPTSPQEFLENFENYQNYQNLENIRFKRQNDEVIEEIEGSGILPDSEYDIVESSGEEIIGEKII